MPSNVRVLAVCTHNRTRSVLMANLFRLHAAAVGLPNLTQSGGFSERGGEEPTDRTVRYLKTRGVDISSYRSHWMSDHSIRGAHLIVTAEQTHVIAIAGRWPDSFDYTFTLPEIVELGEATGPRKGRPLEDWLAGINLWRPAPLDYLDTTVGEVADPTSQSPSDWKAAFERIDDLTERLARLLA